MFKFFNSYLNAEDDTLDVLVCDEAHRIRKHSWDRFRKKDAIDPDRPRSTSCCRSPGSACSSSTTCRR
jgi:uncharacterized protein